MGVLFRKLLIMNVSAAVTSAVNDAPAPAPAILAGALDSFALQPAASAVPAPLSLQQLALPQNR